MERLIDRGRGTEMPMDEDKQLTKGEQLLQDTQEILKKVDKERIDDKPTKEIKIICEQCDAKNLRVGYDAEKEKDVLQNPDGSRHKKWNYPPKKIDGKDVWTFRCTNSKDDWSKKKSDDAFKFKKSEYSQDFPMSSDELVKIIEKNSELTTSIIQSYLSRGSVNTWITLTKFAGCLKVCENIGNTKSAFVGMTFKIGEKVND